MLYNNYNNYNNFDRLYNNLNNLIDEIGTKSMELNIRIEKRKEKIFHQSTIV